MRGQRGVEVVEVDDGRLRGVVRPADTAGQQGGEAGDVGRKRRPVTHVVQLRGVDGGGGGRAVVIGHLCSIGHIWQKSSPAELREQTRVELHELAIFKASRLLFTFFLYI